MIAGRIYVHSTPIKDRCESFFSQRAICEYVRRALFKGLPQPSREKQYQILSICQHLNIDLFLACHKQEPCQPVNKNILAGIMPSKRQGKASGEHDKANEIFHRYIDISLYSDRVIYPEGGNDARKCESENHSSLHSPKMRFTQKIPHADTPLN